ncbi:hypothetical protein [Paenibacillus nasutitermitis]|uniref:Copper amine oxidase-like N-terminal domain-containing protein n=1 Tax=Paenibacillus nasutitermitis TaxID=1652958 RepID=A0A917E4Q1_9BACL|nr:hypothetical protein [Paenibacillus nasutitermitis]GGE02803.1 hypothetical protein GCM10010911_72330 [Paenibacillus nasutitermitis]
MKVLKKKSIMIVLFAAAMLSNTLGSAYAAANLEPIKAFFNKGVSFILHGERWKPTDASGKELSAIVYNNTNYLPVRALAEALKTPIEYDSASQKIYIGARPGAKTPIFSMPMEIDNNYVIQSKNPKETLINGTQYKDILQIEQYGDVYFTIDRKYKRLVLDAAVVSPGEHEVEFSLYNASDLAANTADTVLEMHAVSPEDGVKQLIFNVEGLEKVKIHVQSHLLNPYIYARILDTSYFDNGETPVGK